MTDPLQVFVINRRSGGRVGAFLYQRLVDLVGADRVADLADSTPTDVVSQWGAQPRAYIACGGDGTVAALLDAVADHGLQVPVGLMPLGTGNDLANVLGWPRVHRRTDVVQAVADLASAPVRRFDRWCLTGPQDVRLPWYNYCSVGVDARVAYRFHQLRWRHPGWPWTRLLNQMTYAAYGLIDPGAPLPLELADGAVSSWARMVLWANIRSYAGGGDLGAGVRYDDGLLDACYMRAAINIGATTRGLRPLRRIGQRAAAGFTLTRRCALQIDGEPRLVPAGQYRIAALPPVQVLVASTHVYA